MSNWDGGTYDSSSIRWIGRNNTAQLYGGGLRIGTYGNSTPAHGVANYLGTPTTGEIRTQKTIQSDSIIIQQRSIPVVGLIYHKHSSSMDGGFWSPTSAYQTWTSPTIIKPNTGLYRIMMTVCARQNSSNGDHYAYFTVKMGGTSFCLWRWQGNPESANDDQLTCSTMGIRRVPSGEAVVTVETTHWHDMYYANVIALTVEYMGPVPDSTEWNPRTTALVEQSPPADWS